MSQQYKYFLPIGVFFVAALMISNTVAGKLIQIGSFTFSGAIIIFPISYIFGDIMTEVYGYRASRKIIWLGFGSLVLMSLFYFIVQLLPPASFWPYQQAFVSILGVVPRLVLASIVGYFCGEFSNSFILSKMKIFTNGKYLWTRTIGSTIVGEGVDTILFALIGFLGVVSLIQLPRLIISGYLFKVLYEVAATPLTYYIVKKLKQTEGVDMYDRGVKYNPFVISES